MVTTRQGTKEARARSQKAKQGEKAKVTKPTSPTKKAPKKSRRSKTPRSTTAIGTPAVPEITVTRPASASRDPSDSPGKSAIRLRASFSSPATPPPTEPSFPTPPQSSPPTSPPPPPPPPPPTPRTSTSYIPPKRRRSSQTDAERRRNAIIFYNKLLPIAGEMSSAFESYDGEKEMFEVWHLLEQALAKLARATGHWNLDTMSPGVPLDEEGVPESSTSRMRGRRKWRRRG